MLKPIRYLLCQLELEGIRIVGDRLIRRISADVPEFPLMLLARTCDDHSLICVDDQMPAYLRATLLKSRPQFVGIEVVLRILESSGFLARARHYQTYIFPDDLPHEGLDLVRSFSPDDPKVKAFGMGGLPGRVFAIESRGEILSACGSSRQNHRCAQAWVVTHPRHRRKGYARKVVTAWAASLQEDGIIPFYSHEAQNEASGCVAESLGLPEVFSQTVVERAV
jgi:RimJ/RimL family protein N-acetyltransferase